MTPSSSFAAFFSDVSCLLDLLDFLAECHRRAQEKHQLKEVECFAF